MKTVKYLSTGLLALSLLACQQDQQEMKPLTIGDAYISNAFPMQGDSLTLTYTTGEEIENIIMSYSTQGGSYMEDIAFTPTETGVAAKLRVPDSAVTLAFDVMNGFKTYNEEAITLLVVDAEGKALAGALTGKANYLDGMGKELYGHKVNADSVLSMYRKDLEMHPGLEADHYLKYAAMLMKDDKDKAMALLKKREAALMAMKTVAMEDYQELYRLYNTMKDRKKADSIINILQHDFPESDQAIFKRFNEVQRIGDVNEKEKETQAFIKSYPDHRASQFLISSLAQAYAREGDYNKFLETIQKVTIPETKANAMNSVAWNLAEKGDDLEEAAKISKASLTVIEEAMAAPEWDPAEATRILKIKTLESSLNMFRDTYALIMYKKGDLKEAIKYQGMAAGPEASGDVNERYIKFLIEDQQYDTAIEKASEYIANNASTPQMKTDLKTALSRSEKEGSFEELIAGLEAEARGQLKADVMKKMLNEKASAFTLRDLEGKEIALSDLKGKTVILDFWATWCGPCVSSFPGMQQAKDNYKDDEDIVFLFINTWEGKSAEEQQKLAGNFLEKSGYDFHVLLDNLDPESKTFEVVTNYNVSGIPTKVIIGPDGNIKFQSVGWSGSIDKLVTELDMMIELARS